jgi:hypothetical protein
LKAKDEALITTLAVAGEPGSVNKKRADNDSQTSNNRSSSRQTTGRKNSPSKESDVSKKEETNSYGKASSAGARYKAERDALRQDRANPKNKARGKQNEAVGTAQQKGAPGNFSGRPLMANAYCAQHGVCLPGDFMQDITEGGPGGGGGRSTGGGGAIFLPGVGAAIKEFWDAFFNGSKSDNADEQQEDVQENAAPGITDVANTPATPPGNDPEKDEQDGRYRGNIEPSGNKYDEDAYKLADRIGGRAQVKFDSDPVGREFDVIGDEYIGESKSADSGIVRLDKALRNQAKAIFEAAKATGRTPYFQYDVPVEQKVIDKLLEYGQRYGIDPVIDTVPFE